MRVVDFGDGDLKMLLEAAASMGRGDDTELVHINKAEEKILKESGGSGTINPKTGLKEFKYGGNVSEGGKKQGAADAGGQGPGAAKGGEGKTGERGAGSFHSPTGRLEDRADVKAAMGGRTMSSADAADISREWADRVSGKAGVNIDPVSIGLGALSFANPLLGLIGLGYSGLKATGVIENPPNINIGGGYKSVADLISDKYGIGTSSTTMGDRGKREESRRRVSETKTGRTSVSSAATTASAQTSVPQPQSPADTLLDRYQLPGINSPFALAPYTIDRSRHEQLVSQALQGRQ